MKNVIIRYYVAPVQREVTLDVLLGERGAKAEVRQLKSGSWIYSIHAADPSVDSIPYDSLSSFPSFPTLDDALRHLCQLMSDDGVKVVP